MKKYVLVLAILSTMSVYGQNWLTNGNNPIATDFLGTLNLESLKFKTDGSQRMTLLSTQSSTINGFTGIVQNGFLGISDSPGFFTGPGAASMIHINGGNSIGTQYQGFRP